MGEADGVVIGVVVDVAAVMAVVVTPVGALLEISVVAEDGLVTLMENAVPILEVLQAYFQIMENAAVDYSVVNVVDGDHLCCCLATVEVRVASLGLEAS